MGRGGRAFARVIVQLLLVASFVMWLLLCLSTPTVKMFPAAVTQFDNGFTLRLGIFGYCAGDVCPKTSIGYKVDPALLPTPVYSPYPKNPELNQIMNYKLVGAMLLAPLMAGQLLLALMASLVPQRFFSLVTVVFTLLAWQLGVVILIVHCITFVGADARIRLLYPDNTLNSYLSIATWFLFSGEALAIAAFVFSFCAIEPRRKTGLRAGETGLVAL